MIMKRKFAMLFIENEYIPSLGFSYSSYSGASKNNVNVFRCVQIELLLLVELILT